ncbi:phage protein [Streptococcus pneumoniae]|nr:phage protein [Streptococcus pneumoniae]
MKILAIDPSSNKIETSTTGVVLLDNATLVDSWVVSYGMRGFADWFHEIGTNLEFDVVIVEEFKARDNDKSKDNSVAETIAYIQLCYPGAILQFNAGYKSDIPNDLLKILDLWKFEKSHHQDIRAAARLGLFWAMRNDIEEVVHDIGKVVSEYHNNAKKVAS